MKLFLVLGMVAALAGPQKPVVVQSPSGALAVTLENPSGELVYDVSYNGETVIGKSSLGLVTSIGDLTRDLTLTGVEEGRVEKQYGLRTAKTSRVNYVANELTATFEGGEGRVLTVTFRVSDRDVAFRYGLSVKHPIREPELHRTVVYSEASSFNFPEATTTFICPMAEPGSRWAHARPSYEEVYTPDAPMDVPSAFGYGYSFPCLFHLGDTWALVSETGVGSGYCGAHLGEYEKGKGYAIAYPAQTENGGYGTAFAAVPLPFSTPWRTLTVGPLKALAETTVAYDLVDPLYAASMDYQGGRYTWSWLLWQDDSVNYADQVQMIDLSATMGFEYCLVDNWWDQQIGRDRMAELAAYARSKGVSLMLWYSSNGYWNDAPQTPKHCMNTAVAREREMQWLRSIGIKGIKVDFFGGDKQETLQLYEDILSDANRYGLQVIFHGCTLPRGWERMYPNFVASEAVMASENVYFTPEDAAREAFDLTIHPFCRNAVASMDWGGVILNRYMSRDNKSRHARATTDIFELATGIVNQSAIQCVALYPNNLTEVPPFELDFLRDLPSTWDETRYVEGYPGKYVVLARRHGERWYVAGLNALKEPLTLTLDLPMFAGQAVKCYLDDKKGAPTLDTRKLKADGNVKVTLQPNGGLVLCK